MKQILVIGAGASGLMAAAAAAGSGAQGCVLEGMKKPGRKLLLTGNGRCNLTNMDPGLTNAFHSCEAADARCFAETVIGTDGREKTLSFFSDLGLDIVEKSGYVYPRAEQSGAVLQCLLGELYRLGVKMHYDAGVRSLSFDPTAEKWTASVDGWHYEGDRVILCCGSKAVPSTGSDGSGYALAAALGHKIVPVFPALTAICCPDPDLNLLAGARTRARIRLYRKNHGAGDDSLHFESFSFSPVSAAKKTRPVRLLCPDLPDSDPRRIASETGEVQWTPGEISGIPAFQISRYVSDPGERSSFVLNVDFLPEYEESALARRLENVFFTFGRNGSLKTVLNGLVHDRAAAFLLRKSGLPENACRSADPKELRRMAAHLAALMKRMVFPISGTRSFEQCQVCRGGIALSQVNPQTLESRLHPGLYFAGELLDIDGPCGGYNLQWAWSSGMRAGAAAAK